MKHKILYVEDEPHLGKIVSEILENMHFNVLLINDGALVMEALKEFHPDICILDIMLPNVDGLTLGREIRSKYNNLPIVYLTAKTQTEDVIKGFDSGGTDYIRKPFSIEELIARVKNQLFISNILQNRNSDEISEIVIKSTVFYPEKYELQTTDGTIKLSFRECEILKILVSKTNKIIDRKSLLIAIWGDDSYYNSRTLDVYIKKLRHYFLSEKGVEIHTLKGKGYTFIVHN